MKLTSQFYGGLEKKMDTRSKILEAAKAEFAQNGFHNTLVSDIAERAGVGKGTIYRYFTSKEELFCSIIVNQMEHFEERICRAIKSGKVEKDILFEIEKIHFDEYQRSKDVIAILVFEGLNKDEKIKEEFKVRLTNIQQMVSNVIKQGIHNKVFRQVDPYKTSVIFLGLIWTVLKHGIFMEEKDLEEKYYKVIFDILYNGILR